MTARASADETGHGEGITVVKNEPYDDANGKGQYTEKIIHLGNRLPGWLRALMPGSLLQLKERAWNAFPYTRTEYECPGFGDKFVLKVWSTYQPDNGRPGTHFRPDAHVLFHGLPPEFIQGAAPDIINIATDEIPAKHYKREEDPALFTSKRTGRGPFLPGWEKAQSPVMSCYKLCVAEFKYWGFQTKVEQLMHHGALRGEFVKGHRKVVCWMDEFLGMNLAGVRAYERKMKWELDRRIAGKSIEEMPPPPEPVDEVDPAAAGDAAAHAEDPRNPPPRLLSSRGAEAEDVTLSVSAAQGDRDDKRRRIGWGAHDVSNQDDSDRPLLLSRPSRPLWGGGAVDEDNASFSIYADAENTRNELFEEVALWTNADEVELAHAHAASFSITREHELPETPHTLLLLVQAETPCDNAATEAAAAAAGRFSSHVASLLASRFPAASGRPVAHVVRVPVPADTAFAASAFHAMAAHCTGPPRDGLLPAARALGLAMHCASGEYRRLLRCAAGQCDAAVTAFRLDFPLFDGPVCLIAEGFSGVLAADLPPPGPGVDDDTGIAVSFAVDTLFLLGTPLALFLAARESGLVKPPAILVSNGLSKCRLVFNLTSPADPLATRLEPFLDHRFLGIPPVPVASARRAPLPRSTFDEARAAYPEAFDEADDDDEDHDNNHNIEEGEGPAGAGGEGSEWFGATSPRRRVDYSLALSSAREGYLANLDVAMFVLRCLAERLDVPEQTPLGSRPLSAVPLLQAASSRSQVKFLHTRTRFALGAAAHAAMDVVEVESHLEHGPHPRHRHAEQARGGVLLSAAFRFGSTPVRGERVSCYLLEHPDLCPARLRPAPSKGTGGLGGHRPDAPAEWTCLQSGVKTTESPREAGDKFPEAGFHPTAGAGIAVVQVPEAERRPEGVYPVRWVLEADGSAAVATLFVVPRGAQCVLFEIDGACTAARFPALGAARPRLASGKRPVDARPGAQAVASAWAAKGYLPVYASLRGTDALPELRAFLGRNRFPFGVVVAARAGATPLSASDAARSSALAAGIAEVAAVAPVFAAYAHSQLFWQACMQASAVAAERIQCVEGTAEEAARGRSPSLRGFPRTHSQHVETIEPEARVPAPALPLKWVV